MDSPAVPLVSAVFKLATSASFELVVIGNELALLMDADWVGLIPELSWGVAYGLFDLLSSIMLYYYNICRYASWTLALLWIISKLLFISI